MERLLLNLMVSDSATIQEVRASSARLLSLLNRTARRERVANTCSRPVPVAVSPPISPDDRAIFAQDPAELPSRRVSLADLQPARLLFLLSTIVTRLQHRMAIL